MSVFLENLAKYELVTIAVALLGGDVNYVDREDIAIEVNRLAPGRFAWRKHSNWIDLDVVFTALRNAKKPENGRLLIGDNSRGWMLSPTGLKWIRSLDSTSLTTLVSDACMESISSNQQLERARLRSTRAYGLFLEGKAESISRQDFYQFARVNEYFQTKARLRRYAIIENAIVDYDDLSELWELLKAKFPEEMR